jgi:Uma2 family endonuclease
MNIALRTTWTQEQFFDWAEAQNERYEFDGVQPVLMTGGFNRGAAIGVNLIVALANRLRGTGCRALGPDAGVETINTAVRYPDALITCSSAALKGRKVPGVVAIFEVLGLTADAKRRDRVTKVREYAAVPSILRYVIIDSSAIRLTVLERTAPDQPWQTVVLTGDDTLGLPEIGIEVPVGEFYEDIALPAEDAAEV